MNGQSYQIQFIDHVFVEDYHANVSCLLKLVTIEHKLSIVYVLCMIKLWKEHRAP